MSDLRKHLFLVTLCSASLLVASSAAARTTDGTKPLLRQSRDCRNVAGALTDWATHQVMNRYRPPRPYRHPPRPWVGKKSAPPRPRAKTSRSSGAPAMLEAAPMLDAAPAVASSMGDARREAPTATRAPAAEEKAGPDAYTTTNVQELGVDEADLVKTDGRHIYVASDETVLIFESWPAENTRITSRLTLPDAAKPSQLYLHGDTLMVLSSVQLALGNGRRLPGSRITYIDVSDRWRPAIQRHVDLEGNLQSSRMIGSDLYLVTRAPVHLPQQLVARGLRFLAEHAGNRANHSRNRKLVRAHLRESLTRGELNDALPRVRSRRIGGSYRPLLSCQDVYVPTQQSNLGLVTLTHLPLNRHQVPKTIGVLAGGLQVYSSPEALYVASSNQIHKLHLNAGVPELEPAYAGSGQVPGYILNQFSMSEHRGFLRVATTDGHGNHIQVLRYNGQGLEIVGAVKNLARGERIFSARMMGDKGYVVTFRRTDPLYTLDLSDPFNPKVVGELKINGFSSYIHPLSGDRLLTIGQDADDRGRQLGVHLQIFDVSDPARPTRSHHHRFGQGAQSSAQNDHHALTFDPTTGTLAVPVLNAGPERFTGLMVFEIDPEEGFIERGRVSHGDRLASYWEARCARRAARDRHSCKQIRTQTAPQLTSHPVTMLRSIVMDHYLYSLSFFALEVNDLEQMSETTAAVVLSAEPARVGVKISARM